MSICCCALAGTSACEHCSNKPYYDYKPNITVFPYVGLYEQTERKLQEIENAIKKLNERIDKLVELTQWTRGGGGAVANSVQTPKGE